ncbi:glycosyltransferase family 4 protein [Taibaiella lutea]|uniref:Glycosyltransferase family 4 protein n=1 Tax=Taibaiella lutea TaxID=2608001 RepID=A0A5M6CSX0_9BACT|nr:glycosyltransferase [Taibaiella lutea]KAA5536249.1 glycosyltransferase family 4 protein [Taibaiella lutea]
MKVLQISSVFPVEDNPIDNPYVKNFSEKIIARDSSIKIDIIKPQAFFPSWLMTFVANKSSWKNRLKIISKKLYKDKSFKVHIFPYISIGSISFLHSLFCYFYSLKIVSFLKREALDDSDIIHAHYLFPDGILAYAIKRKLGIPYVLTLRQESRFFKNRYSRYLARKIITRAYAVSTQSFQMHEHLEKLGFNSVKLLPTGIDERFFEVREQIKTESNKIRLVSVCNLLPIKNLKSVLLAISALENKTRLEYTIYGTGPLEKELKEQANELHLSEIVVFGGAIPNGELPDILPNFDVFIQPSFKETFGLSYFEALACNLPVIITENTGAWPLIKDLGVSWKVDPYSISSITYVLNEIIENRDLVAEKAKMCLYAAKIASWENYCNYFLEKYKAAK